MTEILNKVKLKIEELKQRIETHNDEYRAQIFEERLSVYEELLPDISPLITTIESLQTEYADERGAHNLHATELIELENHHSNVVTERNSAWKEIEQKDALIESQKEEIERVRQAAKHWQDRYDGTADQIESLQKENKRQREAIEESFEWISPSSYAYELLKKSIQEGEKP